MLLTIQVEPQALETARQQAARKLSKRIKIPGFRPGKAPYSVVLRTIGEGEIFEEAVQFLANDLYPKAIDEAGIDPYGPGQLTNVPSMEPLILEFLIPLNAEVNLGDYHSIRIPYEPPVITNEDVIRVLDDLRDRHATQEPVDRPAAANDVVEIKLSAIQNNPNEGEKSELIEEHTRAARIPDNDSENEKEWPFSGFSKELIGCSAGDEKTLLHTYPEDAIWESLRNKEVTFTIKVQTVKSHQVPNLDDVFAQSIGDEYTTVQELTDAVRTSLDEQALGEYKADYHTQIVTEIVKNTTIKFPPQMLEQEVQLYLEQLQSRLAQQGLDIDIYLKSRQMDQDGLNKEITPLAEQRLKQTLVIFKIAQQEHIQVTNDEIESESSRALAEISKYMSPEQARKAISDGYIQHLVSNISTDLLVRHTYEFLEAMAKGEKDNQETSQPVEQITEITNEVTAPLSPAIEEEIDTITSPQEGE
mgnify:CR=1 FL=1